MIPLLGLITVFIIIIFATTFIVAVVRGSSKKIHLVGLVPSVTFFIVPMLIYPSTLESTKPSISIDEVISFIRENTFGKVGEGEEITEITLIDGNLFIRVKLAPPDNYLIDHNI